MTGRVIDADDLSAEMYRKSFLVDDSRNRWNSGLWIGYQIFEEAIRDAPTVEAIPVEWIRQYINEHGLYTTAMEVITTWSEQRKEE